ALGSNVIRTAVEQNRRGPNRQRGVARVRPRSVLPGARRSSDSRRRSGGNSSASAGADPHLTEFRLGEAMSERCRATTTDSVGRRDDRGNAVTETTVGPGVWFRHIVLQRCHGGAMKWHYTRLPELRLSNDKLCRDSTQ